MCIFVDASDGVRVRRPMKTRECPRSEYIQGTYLHMHVVSTESTHEKWMGECSMRFAIECCVQQVECEALS